MTTRKMFTPVFRCSFVNLFEPTEGKDAQGRPTGKYSYGLTALFEPNEVGELQKLVEEAVFEKWGNKPPVVWRNPLRPGTQLSQTNLNGFDLEKYPENKGKVVAVLKSPTTRNADGTYDTTRKPGLVDWNNEVIIDRSQVYSGMYARAQIVAAAYDKGSNGVNFYLHNVQKVRDGEPLGSARDRAEDVFAPFAAVPQADNSDMFADLSNV